MMTLEEARAFFANDLFATRQTGVRIEEISPDNAVCSVCIAPEHRNANHTVMGGVLFTLADLCFAAATNTGDYRTVSVDSRISFLRAVGDGTLTARSIPLRIGKTLCFYNVEIRDETGAAVAAVSFTGFRKPAGEHGG